MGGKRKTQIVKVTDLALDRPDLSAAEIGREIGLSKSRVSGILKLPGAAKRVRARLAEGNPIGRATAGIATILATLETLIEETLASPDGLDRDDVADLMTYLAALTGTLDRLGRTGIQLDTVVQTDDDAQLTILILEAWARGVRWAMRYPPDRGRRGARLADRRVAGLIARLDRDA
jgi:hypothetical protein